MEMGGALTEIGDVGHGLTIMLASAAISADPEMIGSGAREQEDCSVWTGLSVPAEPVWWSRTLSLIGSLLSPASAAGPPRGLGGGGALLRRHDERNVLYVQAQTCGRHQGALCLQSPVEGGPP
jgi:hypothetical protein